MNVSSASSVASTLSPEQTKEAVGLNVLKKAIDLEAQNALQLLQTLPQATNNPPNLGNSIDVKA